MEKSKERAKGRSPRVRGCVRFARLPSLVFLARARAGLSQSAMARRVGASATQFCNYERGLRIPTPNHLGHIAELLGIDREVLQGFRLAALADREFPEHDIKVQSLRRSVVEAIEEAIFPRTEGKLRLLDRHQIDRVHTASGKRMRMSSKKSVA